MNFKIEEYISAFIERKSSLSVYSKSADKCDYEKFVKSNLNLEQCSLHLTLDELDEAACLMNDHGA
jgi:hypothetical protein